MLIQKGYIPERSKVSVQGPDSATISLTLKLPEEKIPNSSLLPSPKAHYILLKACSKRVDYLQPISNLLGSWQFGAHTHELFAA